MMARWEPNAQERLAQAAMELFAERGYDGTTVSDIADRAGLTERTFFRYYADKREIIFDGAELLKKTLVDAVAEAPKGGTPMDVVYGALEVAVPLLEARQQFAGKRYALIMANRELQERELVKMATIASAIAGKLVERGTPALQAKLAADAGLSIFRIGFENWIADPKRSYAAHLKKARTALEALMR
jgi:AcrR family transcriptional regulator